MRIFLRSPSFHFRKLNLLGREKEDGFREATALPKKEVPFHPSCPLLLGESVMGQAAEAMPLAGPAKA